MENFINITQLGRRDAQTRKTLSMREDLSHLIVNPKLLQMQNQAQFKQSKRENQQPDTSPSVICYSLHENNQANYEQIDQVLRKSQENSNLQQESAPKQNIPKNTETAQNNELKKQKKQSQLNKDLTDDPALYHHSPADKYESLQLGSEIPIKQQLERHHKALNPKLMHQKNTEKLQLAIQQASKQFRKSQSRSLERKSNTRDQGNGGDYDRVKSRGSTIRTTDECQVRMGSVMKENTLIRGPGLAIVNVQINYETPEDDHYTNESQYGPGIANRSHNNQNSPLLKSSFQKNTENLARQIRMRQNVNQSFLMREKTSSPGTQRDIAKQRSRMKGSFVRQVIPVNQELMAVRNQQRAQSTLTSSKIGGLEETQQQSVVPDIDIQMVLDIKDDLGTFTLNTLNNTMEKRQEATIVEQNANNSHINSMDKGIVHQKSNGRKAVQDIRQNKQEMEIKQQLLDNLGNKTTEMIRQTYKKRSANLKSLNLKSKSKYVNRVQENSVFSSMISAPQFSKKHRIAQKIISVRVQNNGSQDQGSDFIPGSQTVRVHQNRSPLTSQVVRHSNFEQNQRKLKPMKQYTYDKFGSLHNNYKQRKDYSVKKYIKNAQINLKQQQMAHLSNLIKIINKGSSAQSPNSRRKSIQEDNQMLNLNPFDSIQDQSQSNDSQGSAPDTSIVSYNRPMPEFQFTGDNTQNLISKIGQTYTGSFGSKRNSFDSQIATQNAIKNFCAQMDWKVEPWMLKDHNEWCNQSDLAVEQGGSLEVLNTDDEENQRLQKLQEKNNQNAIQESQITDHLKNLVSNNLPQEQVNDYAINPDLIKVDRQETLILNQTQVDDQDCKKQGGVYVGQNLPEALKSHETTHQSLLPGSPRNNLSQGQLISEKRQSMNSTEVREELKQFELVGEQMFGVRETQPTPALLIQPPPPANKQIQLLEHQNEDEQRNKTPSAFLGSNHESQNSLQVVMHHKGLGLAIKTANFSGKSSILMTPKMDQNQSQKDQDNYGNVPLKMPLMLNNPSQNQTIQPQETFESSKQNKKGSPQKSQFQLNQQNRQSSIKKQSAFIPDLAKTNKIQVQQQEFEFKDLSPTKNSLIAEKKDRSSSPRRKVKSPKKQASNSRKHNNFTNSLHFSLSPSGALVDPKSSSQQISEKHAFLFQSKDNISNAIEGIQAFNIRSRKVSADQNEKSPRMPKKFQVSSNNGDQLPRTTTNASDLDQTGKFIDANEGQTTQRANQLNKLNDSTSTLQGEFACGQTARTKRGTEMQQKEVDSRSPDFAKNTKTSQENQLNEELDSQKSVKSNENRLNQTSDQNNDSPAQDKSQRSKKEKKVVTPALTFTLLLQDQELINTSQNRQEFTSDKSNENQLNRAKLITKKILVKEVLRQSNEEELSDEQFSFECLQYFAKRAFPDKTPKECNKLASNWIVYDQDSTQVDQMLEHIQLVSEKLQRDTPMEILSDEDKKPVLKNLMNNRLSFFVFPIQLSLEDVSKNIALIVNENNKYSLLQSEPQTPSNQANKEKNLKKKKKLKTSRKVKEMSLDKSNEPIAFQGQLTGSPVTRLRDSKTTHQSLNDSLFSQEIAQQSGVKNEDIKFSENKPLLASLSKTVRDNRFASIHTLQNQQAFQERQKMLAQTQKIQVPLIGGVTVQEKRSVSPKKTSYPGHSLFHQYVCQTLIEEKRGRKVTNLDHLANPASNIGSNLAEKRRASRQLSKDEQANLNKNLEQFYKHSIQMQAFRNHLKDKSQIVRNSTHQDDDSASFFNQSQTTAKEISRQQMFSHQTISFDNGAKASTSRQISTQPSFIQANASERKANFRNSLNLKTSQADGRQKQMLPPVLQAHRIGAHMKNNVSLQQNLNLDMPPPFSSRIERDGEDKFIKTANMQEFGQNQEAQSHQRNFGEASVHLSQTAYSSYGFSAQQSELKQKSMRLSNQDNQKWAQLKPTQIMRNLEKDINLKSKKINSNHNVSRSLMSRTLVLPTQEDNKRKGDFTDRIQQPQLRNSQISWRNSQSNKTSSIVVKNTSIDSFEQLLRQSQNDSSWQKVPLNEHKIPQSTLNELAFRVHQQKHVASDKMTSSPALVMQMKAKLMRNNPNVDDFKRFKNQFLSTCLQMGPNEKQKQKQTAQMAANRLMKQLDKQKTTPQIV